jgi:hypothetical protein
MALVVLTSTHTTFDMFATLYSVNRWERLLTIAKVLPMSTRPHSDDVHTS